MKTKILFLLILYLPIDSFGQEKEFNYDTKIVTKYAIVAMEEDNAHNANIKRNFRGDYDLGNPLTYGRTLNDCENVEHNIVLVTFNKLDGEGSASVFMVYSKDNYFHKFLNREYSITSAESTMDGFKKNDLGYFLFGCGL